MHTIDEQFTNDNKRWARWRRDAQLLIRISRMLFSYFIAGSRIRRAYRNAQLRNEVLWVDEEFDQ